MARDANAADGRCRLPSAGLRRQARRSTALPASGGVLAHDEAGAARVDGKPALAFGTGARREAMGRWLKRAPHAAIFAVAASCALAGAARGDGPVPVEIRGEPGSYQLYRGGAPYVIRGAGLQAVEDLASLAAYGGNSVRNWAVEDGAILDRAHALGLTVALCLDVQRERHGFDYDDAEAVARQFESIKALVSKHRRHPALLAWIIGNELNHDYRNPRAYDAVNDISKMIHELDPHHPTTTTTAGIDARLAAVIRARAPDLDFLSIQVYGGLFELPDALARIGLDMPLMVTEWGAIGHWEVAATPWGAPIEPHSSAKARAYRRGYEEVLTPLAGKVIGHYAFLWGQKQERTPTWYGVFTADGRRTEAVDALHRAWTGRWPANRAPQVEALLLDGRRAQDAVRLRANATYDAVAQATDPDADALQFEWRLLRESEATQSGGDPEALPEELPQSLLDGAGSAVALRAPQQPGAYRLFVYIGDGNGNVAHANMPFFVEGAAGSG